MCGGDRSESSIPPEVHTLIDLVKNLAAINHDDFLAAQLILLFVHQPGISYRKAADILAHRFGHTWGISHLFISKKLKGLCREFPGLERFVNTDRPSIHAQCDRRIEEQEDNQVLAFARELIGHDQR